MNDAGLIVITAFISPYIEDRKMAREIVGDTNFLEVYLNTPISICEQRDPKGLYKKARAGNLPNFTGISAPYEAPENPELVLDSDNKGIEALADEVIAYLQKNGYLSV